MTFQPSANAEHNERRQRLYQQAIEDLTRDRDNHIRRMLEASRRIHNLDDTITQNRAMLEALRTEASTHDYPEQP